MSDEDNETEVTLLTSHIVGELKNTSIERHLLSALGHYSLYVLDHDNAKEKKKSALTHPFQSDGMATNED